MSALPRCRGRRSWIVTFLAIALVVALATARVHVLERDQRTPTSSVRPGASAPARSRRSASRAATSRSPGARRPTRPRYTVARTNVAPGSLSTTLNGTCAGTVVRHELHRHRPPAGRHQRNDLDLHRPRQAPSWTGAASPASDTVTIPGPSLSLGTTSFTTGGGTTSATVANFFDNEGVTYCVDASSSCPAGKTLGTDTVPATGGTKTTATITIPASLSTGAHTVYAIGSLGSLPTVSISVAPVATPNTIEFSERRYADAHGPGARDVALLHDRRWRRWKLQFAGRRRRRRTPERNDHASRQCERHHVDRHRRRRRQLQRHRWKFGHRLRSRRHGTRRGRRWRDLCVERLGSQL